MNGAIEEDVGHDHQLLEDFLPSHPIVRLRFKQPQDLAKNGRVVVEEGLGGWVGGGESFVVDREGRGERGGLNE